MAECDDLDWSDKRRGASDSDTDSECEDERRANVGETSGNGSASTSVGVIKGGEYGSHEYYDERNEDEENADMGELDYDYSSIEEKIGAGIREKEKGNKLFKQGKYEAAWKQYDKCFVHVYTSKEEWSAIGISGRRLVNQFKLPCHLNRGLCRLRRDDLNNALWDFSEALRIDGASVKAKYRKGLTLTRLVEVDLEKEKDKSELWDLDVATQRLNEAKALLNDALKQVPNDVNIRQCLVKCNKEMKPKLNQLAKTYKQEQKKLYSNLISNLDKDNQRLKDLQDDSVFDDMPKLEKISLSD